jgi:hypothetical protein
MTLACSQVSQGTKPMYATFMYGHRIAVAGYDRQGPSGVECHMPGMFIGKT